MPAPMRRSSAPESTHGRNLIAGIAVLGALLCAPAPRCLAFDVRVDDATFSDGAFRVTFEGVLDAPPARIEAVLLDYSRYRLIDPRVRRAELLAREADGALRVRTLIDACAGIFCRTVQRVERVEHRPGRLFSTVIPAQSDMRRGSARTYWHAEGNGTHVWYVAEFEPDFWVPALIGRGVALRALRESTRRLFRNVEHEANGH
jgi:hypothetical protein